MSTGEIALVGQSKADRKTIAVGFLRHLGPTTYRHNHAPTARSFSMNQGHETLITLDRLDIGSKISAYRKFKS
jgi:hypothetical protein